MANLSDRLRAIPDAKARGRLRVAEVVAAHSNSGLSWVGANGWTFVLDAPPDVHLSAKDSQRVAARFDLTVSDGARVVFRDRILAWDGTPVMVPDGTKRTEIVDGLPVERDNFREDVVAGARIDIEHTVRVVTKDGTQPHIKAKPGTVSTFYATEPGGNGSVNSNSTTYATARTGASQTGSAAHQVGQIFSSPTYFCYEAPVIFDTSALGDSDTISAATLSAYGWFDAANTDFTVTAAESTYDGGAVVGGDFVSGADLAALSTKASKTTVGWSTAGYNDFTSEAAMLTYISKTGSTAFLFYSSRHSAGNAPAGDEYVGFYDADNAGTTNDPKLVVTHAAAPTGNPYYAYSQQ